MGLSDVSFFPELTAELYRRAYSNEEVEKVSSYKVWW